MSLSSPGPLVRWMLPAGCAAILAACAPPADAPSAAATLPSWTFDPAMVFPADGSLTRPEDGAALPDGRLIVADQVHGLRLVETDGRSAPFGGLPAAGYRHAPPSHPGGANGVSMEPGGTHLLVTDIYGGGIYRVDVTTGATEKVYQHQYGVNAAVRDSRGAIWFTQSAQNPPEAGEARMWATVDVPAAEGALYRLPMPDGRAGVPELKVDSLFFANGVAIDEASGHLYLAEIVAGRVLRFRVDVSAGSLSDQSVFVDSVAADNLKLDGEGHLWMALPIGNELLVVNTATGARHSAFRSVTPEQQAIGEEFLRRGLSGTSRLELFTPALWAPLPGPVTGMILSPGNGPVYLTGLGNALVRLPR